MRSNIDSNLIVQVVIAGVLGLCSGVITKGLSGVIKPFRDLRHDPQAVLERHSAQVPTEFVVMDPNVDLIDPTVTDKRSSGMTAGSRRRRRPVYRHQSRRY